MDKYIPVVVIKEIEETDKILTALKNYGIKNPIIDISNGINVKFFEKNEELGKKFRKDFTESKTNRLFASFRGCGKR